MLLPIIKCNGFVEPICNKLAPNVMNYCPFTQKQCLILCLWSTSIFSVNDGFLACSKFKYSLNISPSCPFSHYGYPFVDYINLFVYTQCFQTLQLGLPENWIIDLRVCSQLQVVKSNPFGHSKQIGTISKDAFLTRLLMGDNAPPKIEWL